MNNSRVNSLKDKDGTIFIIYEIRKKHFVTETKNFLTLLNKKRLRIKRKQNRTFFFNKN